MATPRVRATVKAAASPSSAFDLCRCHIVTFCAPVRARPLEAPTARLDSPGYQVDGRLRPRVEKGSGSILFAQPAAAAGSRAAAER
eukprot:scaffold8677_cov36-Phaeocystis_antarctica.AAC.1